MRPRVPSHRHLVRLAVLVAVMVGALLALGGPALAETTAPPAPPVVDTGEPGQVDTEVPPDPGGGSEVTTQPEVTTPEVTTTEEPPPVTTTPPPVSTTTVTPRTVPTTAAPTYTQPIPEATSSTTPRTSAPTSATLSKNVVPVAQSTPTSSNIAYIVVAVIGIGGAAGILGYLLITKMRSRR
ncbi:hypothetical protein ABLE94_18865 [Gordonia sp. VNK1]|uniref:hypothetical protein n=1 Tax=Gordonia oleivorans TaxID=3156618 RepID=UPI0032B5C74D